MKKTKLKLSLLLEESPFERKKRLKQQMGMAKTLPSDISPQAREVHPAERPGSLQKSPVAGTPFDPRAGGFEQKLKAPISLPDPSQLRKPRPSSNITAVDPTALASAKKFYAKKGIQKSDDEIAQELLNIYGKQTPFQGGDIFAKYGERQSSLPPPPPSLTKKENLEKNRMSTKKLNENPLLGALGSAVGSAVAGKAIDKMVDEVMEEDEGMNERQFDEPDYPAPRRVKKGQKDIREMGLGDVAKNPRVKKMARGAFKGAVGGLMDENAPDFEMAGRFAGTPIMKKKKGIEERQFDEPDYPAPRRIKKGQKDIKEFGGMGMDLLAKSAASGLQKGVDIRNPIATGMHTLKTAVGMEESHKNKKAQLKESFKRKLIKGILIYEKRKFVKNAIIKEVNEQIKVGNLVESILKEGPLSNVFQGIKAAGGEFSKGLGQAFSGGKDAFQKGRAEADARGQIKQAHNELTKALKDVSSTRAKFNSQILKNAELVNSYHDAVLRAMNIYKQVGQTLGPAQDRFAQEIKDMLEQIQYDLTSEKEQIDTFLGQLKKENPGAPAGKPKRDVEQMGPGKTKVAQPGDPGYVKMSGKRGGTGQPKGSPAQRPNSSKSLTFQQFLKNQGYEDFSKMGPKAKQHAAEQYAKTIASAKNK